MTEDKTYEQALEEARERYDWLIRGIKCIAEGRGVTPQEVLDDIFQSMKDGYHVRIEVIETKKENDGQNLP